MKTTELVDDFIKVWLGDLPNHERLDAIKALETLIESVINDVQGIAKETLKEQNESKS